MLLRWEWCVLPVQQAYHHLRVFGGPGYVCVKEWRAAEGLRKSGVGPHLLRALASERTLEAMVGLAKKAALLNRAEKG